MSWVGGGSASRPSGRAAQVLQRHGLAPAAEAQGDEAAGPNRPPGVGRRGSGTAGVGLYWVALQKKVLRSHELEWERVELQPMVGVGADLWLVPGGATVAIDSVITFRVFGQGLFAGEGLTWVDIVQLGSI